MRHPLEWNATPGSRRCRDEPVRGPKPYAALFETGDCRLTRFEPPLVPDGFPKARPNERFLPHLIWDGRDHPVRLRPSRPDQFAGAQPQGLALYRT